MRRQRNQNNLRNRNFFGEDGAQKHNDDDEGSLSYGKDTPLRMLSGSLHRFLATRILFKLTYRLVELKKINEAIVLST